MVVDKAIIFSDRQMSSPVGYVSRGKKIMVGEVPRNKNQVFPIVVAGKIAYIRSIDISTEKESIDSKNLTAERFKEVANKLPETKVVFSYFNFVSSIAVNNKNDKITDGDQLIWQGIGLKAEALVNKKYDFQLMSHYLGTGVGKEGFRAVEVGLGGTYRLIQSKKFLMRFEGSLLYVPYATYSYGSDFRVNSHGYSSGVGLNTTLLFTEHLGLEAFGSFNYIKLASFQVPEPYKDIAPAFVGYRFGLGLNYTF